MVSVGKVQSTDRLINQLQSNIIGGITELSNQTDQVTIIGELKTSTLTLQQFQQQAGPSWVLCDGSSAVGTSYNKITDFLTVPNIPPVGGVSTFIRVN